MINEVEELHLYKIKESIVNWTEKNYNNEKALL